MAVPESELDRLFSLPLDEFVAERKRIAKTLAQAGQKDEARALDKIPRPSVSAWAVNQVARRDPGLVRRLGQLTERLRGTQGRGGGGGDNGDDFAAMTAEHRQALGTLRDMVDEVLAGAGTEASPQLLRRVITNLRAGVASADTRPLIESGRLVRDVEEADFTTLFEALPPSGSAAGERPAARKAPPPAPPLPPRAASVAGADDDDVGAATRMAAERAEREAERAREKARASAERRLVRLHEAATSAREALAAEERTVAAARAALAAKEEHLARVRAASEEAAAKVAEIEAELERLR